jgi:hypothetical protein
LVSSNLAQCYCAGFESMGAALGGGVAGCGQERSVRLVQFDGIRGAPRSSKTYVVSDQWTCASRLCFSSLCWPVLSRCQQLYSCRRWRRGLCLSAWRAFAPSMLWVADSSRAEQRAREMRTESLEEAFRPERFVGTLRTVAGAGCRPSATLTRNAVAPADIGGTGEPSATGAWCKARVRGSNRRGWGCRADG